MRAGDWKATTAAPATVEVPAGPRRGWAGTFITDTQVTVVVEAYQPLVGPVPLGSHVFAAGRHFIPFLPAETVGSQKLRLTFVVAAGVAKGAYSLTWSE